MLRILLALTLAMICCVVVSAQQTDPQCPTISVNGPVGIPKPGDLIPFFVDVNPSGSRLSYKWTISNGVIASGQGTSSIRVSISSSETIPTVTVRVEGLPEKCPNIASETTIIDPPPEPIKLETLSLPLNSAADKSFQTIGNAVRENPDTQLFVFLPSNRKTREVIVKRLNEVVPENNGDAQRITFVEKKAASATVEIWLVPPGASTPKCDECSLAQSKIELTDQNGKLCPTIEIVGPSRVAIPGSIVQFRSTIKHLNNRRYQYNWSVNDGIIVQGKRTRTIKVLVTGNNSTLLKAYIDVTGFPYGCSGSSNSVVPIAPLPPIDPYNRYKAVSLGTEKEKLDSAAFAQRTTHRGWKLLLVKVSPAIDNKIRLRVRLLRSFLRNVLRLKTNQFQIVTKIGRSIDNTIWFVRPGSDISPLLNRSTGS